MGPLSAPCGRGSSGVLVVDDEPYNRGWLTSLLRTVGFDVQEAETANRRSCSGGVETAADSDDMRMPG